MKLSAGFIMDVIDTLYVRQCENPNSKATHALLDLASGFTIEIIVRPPEHLSESTTQPALTDVDVLL